MATTSLRGTAKIYQFPVKARAISGGYRSGGSAVADLPGGRLARTDFGSGRYHDDAIAAEASARKRDDH